MRPRTKIMVVALMATVVSCSIFFFIPSRLADCIVAAAGAIGIFVVCILVPTAK
jgi:hypothetical protein